MSGILGIWNHRDDPLAEGSMAQMLQTLAHRGPDGSGIWRTRFIGLACQMLRVTPEAAQEVQPCIHPTGPVLVWDGRLDNRKELWAQLPSSERIPPDCPDPVLVLEAYVAFGERFAEKLNGDFALGLFSPSQQRLYLARDVMGTRPLYYCRLEKTTLFASEIKALLGHPDLTATPNDDLLAAFLLKTLADVEQTLFSGIFSVLPGHMVVITPLGLTKRCHWDFDPTRRIRLKSPGQYQEALRELFAQAVRRRLRSLHPVTVSVSGGVDSSAIFCMGRTLLHRAAADCPDLLGVSFTTADGSLCDERYFLDEIQRAYGVKIHQERIHPSGILEGAKEAVRVCEMPRLDHLGAGLSSRLLSIARAKNSRVLLTGEGGDDVLTSMEYLTDLFGRFAWGRILSDLGRYSQWMWDVEGADFFSFFRIFSRNLLRHHLPSPFAFVIRRLRPPPSNRTWYSRDFYRRAFRRTRSKPLPRFWSSHAQSLYERARGAVNVLFLEWVNKATALHGLEEGYPFLDRDLVAFLMAIPGDQVTCHGIPKGLFRQSLRGILPDSISKRRWKGCFTNFVNTNVTQDYPRIVEQIMRERRSIRHGYVEEKRVGQILAAYSGNVQGPTCEKAWSLCSLLGLELWLECFFQKPAHPTRRIRSP